MAKITFEEKMKKLEEITSKLEQEQLSLDESIKLYQEGKKLQKELTQELDEASKKVATLMQDDESVDFVPKSREE